MMEQCARTKGIFEVENLRLSRSQHNRSPCQSLLERSRFGCYYPLNHQFDGGNSDARQAEAPQSAQSAQRAPLAGF